jgi:membrane protein involved in colicin uptake
MAIEKEINLNVNSNIEGSIGQLKALKRELKGVDVGTEEFKKLYNQIDNLEDKIKSAKNKSSDWIDSLENAGGPLGMVGTALNSLKVSTQSFGAALKATGIGLIVIALGGLAAAFSQNDNAMKKIKPLLDGMQKILQGVFKAVEPLLDAFLDLAMKALPYVTQGIGLFYSALVGLFTLVKEVGGGYIKMMKGIVTLDFDAAKEGFNQIKDGFSKAVKSGEEAYARFQAGSKEQTASEKEELAKRREEEKKHQEELAKKQKDANDKAKEERKKAIEEAKKAEEDRRKSEQDLEKKYLDELLNLNAKTDQEKLDLQKQRDLDEINRIAKTANEKANLLALFNEKYATLQIELNDKQKAEADKKQADRDALNKADADKKAQEDISREKLVADAKKSIQDAEFNNISNGLSLLKGLFEKNKGLQKALLIAESAAGIAKIIVNTQAANAAARLKYALLPGGAALAAAESVMNRVSAGIGIAANIAGTAKALSALGGGGGASGVDVGGGGGMSAPAAPSFNVVGNSGVNQVANVLNNQGMPPIKTYVTAGEVTTQQGLNRNIVSNATLG